MFVDAWAAVVIGIVAGGLVVFSVIGLDKIQINDPVGALSVHLTNGIWDTLAIGVFATTTAPGGIDRDGLFAGGGLGLLGSQFLGVVAVGAFTFVLALIVWATLRALGCIRVTPDQEVVGLDVSEMGMEAYPGDSVADVR